MICGLFSRPSESCAKDRPQRNRFVYDSGCHWASEPRLLFRRRRISAGQQQFGVLRETSDRSESRPAVHDPKRQCSHHGRTSGYSPSRRRRVALSQEIKNHKRRWLKKILSVGTPRALWLAPAFLAPISVANFVTETAQAQSPAASRSISDGEVAVDANFVIGWLNTAAKRAESQDMNGSAAAFAEAVRGLGKLPAADARVDAKLQEVQQQLLNRGMQRKQVEDAMARLGAVKAPPSASPVATPAMPTAATQTDSPLDRRDRAAALTQAASQAIDAGDRAKAQQLLAQAEQLSVPDNWMLQGQMSVTQLKNKLGGVVPASANGQVVAAGVNGMPPIPGNVAPGVFNPGQDATSTQPASSQIRLAQSSGLPGASSGEELYRNGLDLLSQGRSDEALNMFRQAWQFQGEMDPALRNQLKDKLSSMQAISLGNGPEQVSASPLQQLDQEQLAMRQRMMSEVVGEIEAAEANRELEPNVVSDRLQTLRTRVSQANLDGESRKRMLSIVDRAITAHEIYMSQNKAAIDQNMRNQQITEQIAQNQEARTATDQKIISLVETYNQMMRNGEYMQAEAVAKQVGTLDPDSIIAASLIANARNRRRIEEYEDIRTMKEDGFIDNMITTDLASIPFDDRQPLIFGDTETWEELTKNRARTIRESQQGMSIAEAAIWEKLKTSVLVNYTNRPLSEVIRSLSDAAAVPIYINEQDLGQEGLTAETPVTLNLPEYISLKSALNLLLGPMNLDFRVANEVLMITSARRTAQANVERTYAVKDLVIPIPNFITDYNSGMAGALRQAYETVGRGLAARTSAPSMGGGMQFASASLDPNAPVLGQLRPGMPAGGNLPGAFGGGFGLGPSMGGSGGMMGGSPMQMGSPGAIGGGAAQADFDTLINLIQQTIEPDSWVAAGGQSSILPYPQNLSLVVSAPQTTHEKIADLLESLRRLQDLQVTIEVKFITLNDNFFERIGVDFDVRIDDNVRQLPLDDEGPSTVVGLSSNVSGTDPFPITADFDIALSQNSFASAIPAFGGFDDASGASLGFAILSDLEMFFFMNAAQGDQRTNVLQAPRVTMFDGQFASINDTISRPFVTSLIPVVADFAVAQQPVIVVLNEGTVLNVQATVSPDKRFVRLTLNPTFSQIDRVDTFTFEGSRTTRSGSNVLDPDGNVSGSTDNSEEVISGTTVQQPSFANTSISTTVSVPDGGTILLGGIKRMREGRLERGVPILSKIPYVNRLFKNTAIGRETSTLMMTVTPRIIIQEEEEQKYGVNP